MSQQPHYTDHSGLWRDWTMRPTLKNREKYLKSICKMFLLFLPSSCIFPHLHYWKCCKANSAMSRNHLHDEPRQCKEVWPPLLSQKDRDISRERCLLSWTFNIGRVSYTLKLCLGLLRTWRKLRRVTKTFKCLILRWFELGEMDPDLQLDEIKLAKCKKE